MTRKELLILAPGAFIVVNDQKHGYRLLRKGNLFCANLWYGGTRYWVYQARLVEDTRTVAERTYSWAKGEVVPPFPSYWASLADENLHWLTGEALYDIYQKVTNQAHEKGQHERNSWRKIGKYLSKYLKVVGTQCAPVQSASEAS